MMSTCWLQLVISLNTHLNSWYCLSESVIINSRLSYPWNIHQPPCRDFKAFWLVFLYIVVVETEHSYFWYQEISKNKSEWFIQLLLEISDNFLLLLKCMIINDFIDIQLQLSWQPDNQSEKIIPTQDGDKSHGRHL